MTIHESGDNLIPTDPDFKNVGADDPADYFELCFVMGFTIGFLVGDLSIGFYFGIGS